MEDNLRDNKLCTLWNCVAFVIAGISFLSIFLLAVQLIENTEKVNRYVSNYGDNGLLFSQIFVGIKVMLMVTAVVLFILMLIKRNDRLEVLFLGSVVGIFVYTFIGNVYLSVMQPEFGQVVQVGDNLSYQLIKEQIRLTDLFYTFGSSTSYGISRTLISLDFITIMFFVLGYYLSTEDRMSYFISIGVGILITMVVMQSLQGSIARQGGDVFTRVQMFYLEFILVGYGVYHVLIKEELLGAKQKKALLVE